MSTKKVKTKELNVQSCHILVQLRVMMYIESKKSAVFVL